VEARYGIETRGTRLSEPWLKRPAPFVRGYRTPTRRSSSFDSVGPLSRRPRDSNASPRRAWPILVNGRLLILGRVECEDLTFVLPYDSLTCEWSAILGGDGALSFVTAAFKVDHHPISYAAELMGPVGPTLISTLSSSTTPFSKRQDQFTTFVRSIRCE
jgi:hypothetical protein